MVKGSAMGGGEFEYAPHKLEEKINNRIKYTQEKTKYVSDVLDNICLEYSALGLGSFDSIRKSILRELVLKLRCDSHD